MGALHQGAALSGGADRKWDTSRQIRQKFLNPAGIPLADIPPSDDPSHHTTFPNYPSTSDGDARPGGAGAIDASMVPVVGNDDAQNADEINDPYSGGGSGVLLGNDTPRRAMFHTVGANGNTVEWRLHFIEFTRLELAGNWYRISDDFPWRLHIKLKKDAGKWVDDGSNKATDNNGF